MYTHFLFSYSTDITLWFTATFLFLDTQSLRDGRTVYYASLRAVGEWNKLDSTLQLSQVTSQIIYRAWPPHPRDVRRAY